MEIDELRRLIQVVSESNLSEFSYEENGVKVSMSGKTPVLQQAVLPQSAVQPVILQAAAPQLAAAGENTDVPENSGEEQKQGNLITSPLVGVFYTAPAEDAEPFVKVGDQVKEGQVVAIVEAMKLMNEIECDCSGTVAEVLAENGQAVEYGQPLFRIVP